MADRLTIGLDIGATKMAFAVVDVAGTVLDETVLPTLSTQPYAQTVERIAAQLNTYLAEYPLIEGIGIGVPGPINREAGVVLNAVNLGWQNCPLRDDLLAHLTRTLPVYIENDVNVGLISEYFYGKAKDMTHCVYLAIGTGLGGAVIINDQLMRGATYMEMEIGHYAIDPVNGRQCTCGQRGCVEMSISGKGLVSNATAHHADYPDTIIPGDDITTYAIIDAARKDDPLATFVIDEAAEVLGQLCAWCTMIFNPNLIVLGGGLSHGIYDLVIEKTRAEMRKHCLPQSYDAVSIELSHSINAAMGASALVWYFQKESQLS